ncbi:MAG: hypothetical protein WBF89_17700 [Steroidobacteraceae bacterium]
MLALALAARPAAPAELTPVVREHTLGVHIGGILWPANFTQDLVSGLTNTVLIHVALFSDSRELDQKTVAIAIKYDLWEETFALTVTVNEAAILTRTGQRQPQIAAFLADLELPQLFAVSELPKDGAATVRVEVLLNPIERERLQTIKKWVIENNTSIPADTNGFSDKRVGSSRSNDVFNKILQQYAAGAEEAASWKESLSSKPFKISEMEQ